MGFFKQHLANIAGIEIYPIISLLIFFAFFVALGVYVVLTDRRLVNRMKQMPLDDGRPESAHLQ
jgi:cytochrome c oxidase cbb3-type subunit 3